MTVPATLLAPIECIVEQIASGFRVRRVAAFGVDESDDGAITKAIGYGKPLLIEAGNAAGELKRMVFHTAASNSFGHDRRADRAAEMLLAFDTFGAIPRHAKALDVGCITADGRAISVREGGEFYLVTSYAEGHVYAEELSRAGRSRTVTERDRRHALELARFLAELHRPPLDASVAYVRSVRDLIGGGEGIFGIIDGYPPDISEALRKRLERLERQALAWRWRLKRQTSRARTIHGDFHPFNLLFGNDDALTLLDASRGCIGEPADDVACLSINYVFFALTHPGAWEKGFRLLWTDFWNGYLGQSNDRELLDWVAPYFAWRLLVLASPTWYSGLEEPARNKLLDLAERALESARFDPAMAEQVFS